MVISLFWTHWSQINIGRIKELIVPIIAFIFFYSKLSKAFTVPGYLVSAWFYAIYYF
jgi:hypothetical protein